MIRTGTLLLAAGVLVSCGAAVYEAMFQKTPAEYREQVNRYFEEVARVGGETK